jgi:hypothetical protein
MNFINFERVYVMNKTQELIIVAVVSAVIGGIAGAICSGGVPEDAKFKSITVDKIKAKEISSGKVQGDEIVSVGENEQIRASLMKGNIIASKNIIGGNIKAKRIVGQNIFAAVNPIQDFNKLNILAELSASPKSGGKLVVLNPAGVYVPEKGATKKGFLIFAGFDEQYKAPMLYTQDIAQGGKGTVHIIKRVLQKTDKDAKKDDKKKTSSKRRR